MCEQCPPLADTQSYGEVLEGWRLIRARKQGHLLKPDDWGLVQMNDPDFVWTVTPEVDPQSGLTDEQINACSKEEHDQWWAWMEKADEFEIALESDPMTGYELILAAMKKGYNPDVYGRFAYWLFDHLGQWLKDHPEPIKEDKGP